MEHTESYVGLMDTSNCDNSRLFAAKFHHCVHSLAEEGGSDKPSDEA